MRYRSNLHDNSTSRQPTTKLEHTSPEYCSLYTAHCTLHTAHCTLHTKLEHTIPEKLSRPVGQIRVAKLNEEFACLAGRAVAGICGLNPLTRPGCNPSLYKTVLGLYLTVTDCTAILGLYRIVPDCTCLYLSVLGLYLTVPDCTGTVPDCT